MSKKKTELQILRTAPRSVELVNGEKYEIPRSDLGQEMEVMEAAKNIAVAAIQSGLLGGAVELSSEEATANLLQLLLGTSPSELVRVAAAICRQDEEWAKRNLDTEGAIDVIVPFLRTKSASLAAKLREYTTVPASPQKSPSPPSSTSSVPSTEAIH